MTETTEFFLTDGGGTTVNYRVRINDRSDETLEEYRRVLLPLQRAQSEQAKADLLSVMQEDAASWGQEDDDAPAGA